MSVRARPDTFVDHASRQQTRVTNLERNPRRTVRYVAADGSGLLTVTGSGTVAVDGTGAGTVSLADLTLDVSSGLTESEGQITTPPAIYAVSCVWTATPASTTPAGSGFRASLATVSTLWATGESTFYPGGEGLAACGGMLLSGGDATVTTGVDVWSLAASDDVAYVVEMTFTPIRNL